ncbi:MAG: hypothetical protein DWH78_12225 [Planctomycetota bacterium]|nr:MAG: hypothetical protein DWH78_12225 [Planctomycetota bacterium]
MRENSFQFSVFSFQKNSVQRELVQTDDARRDAGHLRFPISDFKSPKDLQKDTAKFGSPQFTSYQSEGTASVPVTQAATQSGTQIDTQSFQTTELDLPETTTGILLLFGGLAALIALTVRTSLQDSRFLQRSSRIALLVPRLILLLLLLVIVLNPQKRTQLSRVEKSRVGILLDTSLSMAWPANDEAGGPAEERGGEGGDQGQPETSGPAENGTRADAALKSLVESGVLAELSKTHSITFYTFDSQLAGPWAIVSDNSVRFVDIESKATTTSANATSNAATMSLDEKSDDAHKIADPSAIAKWQRILQPRGAETRLGDSLYQMIGQITGRTLSGVVVLSDGQSNAGLNVEPARVRAERTGTKLITIGIGSQKPQMNLWIAGMQSPTDVHQGDPFDVNIMVQGTGAAGQQGTARLFQQSTDGDGKDRRQISEQTIEFTDDTLPTSIRFNQQLTVPGKYDFVIRIESAAGATEMTLEDNERRRTIEVNDRRMKVLVISSGPMRDYQFVRNALFRHSGVESDVWLQSVTDENVGFVSQEAKTLLTKFPATEAELFSYDVIVAFDPDWSRLSSEQQTFLNRWVSDHSGGLVVVAGEIFTPKLAQDSDAYRDISVLYPVLLNRMLPEMQLTQRADEPWPLTLTQEGRATEFLKIADATGNASVDLWSTFKGIYRSYPVRGLRDGAVVLLEYGNPRARTELGQPPFLASQFFGTGRCIFIGSAETWRLREISSEGHQRFWTSLIREVGQGRRSRGTARGLLLLDRTEVAPGQPVNIRAQLYDARLQPLVMESVPLNIVDSEGKAVSIPDRLNADGRGAGQYVSSFRPTRSGAYRISVPIPESSDVLQTTIDVVLPNLESQNPTQNAELLTNLTKETQGQYLSLSQISTLPSLLTDQSQPVVVDERLQTLWDRGWILFLMVTLLAFEWILRRVWRLS